jgi:hypothetical protein
VAGLHRARLDELIEPRDLRHHGVADRGQRAAGVGGERDGAELVNNLYALCAPRTT